MAGIREGAVGELEALLAAGGPEAIAAREALERLAEDDSRARVGRRARGARRPADGDSRQPEPRAPEPEPTGERTDPPRAAPAGAVAR